MLHPNGVFNLWGEGVAKKGRTQVWSKQLRFGSNWMKSFWSCSVIYCTWNIRTHWDLDDRHVWFQPSQRRHRPPSNPERASCFQWQWLVYKHTYATEWTSISNTWGRFKIMLLWLAFYSFSRGISCQFKKRLLSTALGPKRGGFDCTGFPVRPCRTCAAWAETISGTSDPLFNNVMPVLQIMIWCI